MEQLLTIEQIRNNLRRTASENLISLINKNELEQLSLKHYGEYDKDGILIGYRCPYSGYIINDFKDLVLEHIIPVSSKGGTVLFNCIPTSSIVNSYNEKGSKHLLAWWKKKDYYSPEKLNELLLYIFEAYDIVFKNHTIEEIENSYSDFEFNNVQNENVADITTTAKRQKQELKSQSEKTGLISYLGFIKDCINELKANNYDVSMYEKKLDIFEKHEIFTQIDRYAMFQNALKEAIKYKLQNSDHSELTFTLNINIHNIMKSMSNFNKEQDIYNELVKRLTNLEQILSQYNIGLISYFEDLKNLSNIDILAIPIELIKNDHIKNIIDTINLCVADNFDNVIQWHLINKSGTISKSAFASNEVNKLRNFIEKFYAVDTKGSTFFHTRLTYEQLKYLCNSNDIRLKSIYIKILQKSIIHKIPIAYDNKTLRRNFEEIYNNNGKFSDNFIDDLPIEDQKQIYNFHLEIEKSKFISLLEWYENKENLGKNPDNDSLESDFIHSIIGVGKRKNSHSFNINLSKTQLKYLHDSTDMRIFSFYIKRLQKSIIYKIPMEFENDYLRKIFEEIYYNNGKFSNNFIDDLPIEKQKNIYNSHPEIKKSKFISLIEWYENQNNLEKKQPVKNVDFDIYGNSLLNYYNRLFQISKSKNQYCFNINLSVEQMNYLKNSNDIRLKIIYVERIKKAKEYNIKLDHIEDKNIISSNPGGSIKNNYILELSIEEQRQIYDSHPEIKKSKFISLIEWYEKEENISKFFPQKTKDSSSYDKNMRTFYETLTAPYFGKRGNSFECNLSEEQLKYLCNSDDIRLKLIYIKILQKSLIHNIPIRYTDENLKCKILTIYDNAQEFSNNFIDDLPIMEQKQIYQNNVNLEKSLFISLIEWYENSSNSQISNPKQKVDLTEDGKDLGVFLQQIKSARKTKNGYSFGKKLSYIQLKYLHDSNDIRLNNLYNEILEKAINNNIRIAYYPENTKRSVSKL